jgi:hypothetical protein
MTVSFTKTFLYSTYFKTRTFLESNSSSPTKHHVLSSTFLAGCFAGGVLTPILSPIELFKVMKQLEKTINPNHIKPTSYYVKRLYSEKGIKGLYTGISWHLGRDVFGTGLYFGSYEFTKTLLLKSNLINDSLVYLLSGGICGIIAWICIFPFDLIKSGVQKQALQPNIKSGQLIAKSIMKKYNLKGFYHGFSATIIRAFPIHALNWLVYENIFNLCTKYSL